MTVQQQHIRIHAQIEAIGQASQFVGSLAEQAGLDSKARHHCQLAIDEACTNIIEHGFSGGNPDEFIDVFCQRTAETFDIVVIDDGPAFDPLQQPSPDPLAGLDERQMGGWGVYFIKKLMDRVAYEHRDGRNHLYMAKRLPTEHSVKTRET